MTINPYTILPITCLLLAILSGTFVILKNPKAKLNRIFFFICITIAVWFSFYIPFNFPISEFNLITWFRVSYCFISFIPIACFTFTTTYLNAPKNLFWYRINTIIGLIFCLMSLFTDWIVKGIYYYPWHPYPKAGLGHPFLIIHCFYLAYFSLHLMSRAMKNPGITSKELNHLRYMSAAIFALSFGSLDFMENYGITFYTIGYISASAFLIIVTIAIIKHQLMDIKIVLRKSVIYTILISLITLFYILSIYTIEDFFKELLGYKSFLFSLFTATIIAIVFIPLKNLIQTFVEKTLFRGSYVQIAEENELLRQEVLQTERLKAVATLASGMAHEIKNPLTVIKTFSEFLPHKLDDKAFLNKFAPMITYEVDRIDNLVHELLDFARPANPNLTLVNIHHLIDSTLDFLSNDFLKNRIEIKKKYCLSQGLCLSLDQNQIKQALLNIILNAIDAMNNGGILELGTSFNHNKSAVQIKVHDTGIGISHDDLEHIFDPFFTKKDSGTGLGLSITHEIIKKHGGKIYVESKKGNGTTFILEFPLFK